MAKIGRYETLFWIASGGMADVHAGRRVGEAGFEKLVAIKKMRPHLASDEQFVQLFLDEARIAALVNSPHVVSTLDLDRQEDGSLFLVMDLVVGSPLSRLMRALAEQQQTMSMGVAVEIISQACIGLHDAHEARNMQGEWMKIVHRDVSPHNIMVGLDGRARVTDFGVARAKERNVQTTTGMVRGKPAYFSPEQANGLAIDRRSDVFALGVVAWELLVGRPLFASAQPLITMSRVVSEEIPLASEANPQVPESLARVVARALERPVSLRYQDAETLALDLRAAAAEHFPRARPGEIAEVVRQHGGVALNRIEEGLTQIRRASLLGSSAPSAAGAQGMSFRPTVAESSGEAPSPSAIPPTLHPEVSHPGGVVAPPAGEPDLERSPSFKPFAEIGSAESDPGSPSKVAVEARTQPTGKVAIVYTDIEGAARLWEERGEAARAAIAHHDEVLATLLVEYGGERIGRDGDGRTMLFDSTRAGLDFCLRAQEALHDADWADTLGDDTDHPDHSIRGLRIRMGIHVGEVGVDMDADTGERRFYGATISRTAGICRAAHGGQILLSRELWETLGEGYEGASIEDLGMHVLRGFKRPEHLYQALPSRLMTRSFPKVRARPLRRTNLPVRMDSFVGRKSELEQISQLLDGDGRLVTLLGPGGTGKTRLAQQFGHQNLEAYAGGVWFADLTEATTCLDACQILTGELHVAMREENPVAQIGEVFEAQGNSLLILDNVEQMVGEAGGMIREWMNAAPALSLIVTSRERLQIRDEQVLTLAPLTLPEALHLFRDRARRVNPNFEIKDEERRVVEAIVEGLDRSSLAIELAAARLDMLAPAQLLERLSERFKLLRSRDRDVHDRQATLRGAIDWSWNLLDDAERITLAQCSPFRGGFTLEAAEAVVNLEALEDAPWTMDILQSLYDKSLIVVRHPENAGRRFHMYESIREYAREKLLKPGSILELLDRVPDDGRGEEEPTGKVALRGVLTRHARFYAQFGMPDRLASLDEEGGFARQSALKLDLDNLRLAIETATLVGEGDRAADACVAACEVLGRSGPLHLAAELVQQTLDRASEETAMSSATVAKLRCVEGRSLLFSGHQEGAEQALNEAQSLAQGCGDLEVEAKAIILKGVLAWERGLLRDARRCLTSGLTLARQAKLPVVEGMALSNLGMLGASEESDLSPRQYYESSLEIYQRIGNRRMQAITEGNLGLSCLETRDFKEARRYCEAARAKSREMGARRLAGYWQGSLGQIALYEGDWQGAEEMLVDAIQICRDTFWKASEGRFTGMLAEVHGHLGDVERAEAGIRHAETLLTEVGHQVELVALRCRQGMIAALRGEEGAATIYLQQAEEALEDIEGSHPQLEYECERLNEILESGSLGASPA